MYFMYIFLGPAWRPEICKRGGSMFCIQCEQTARKSSGAGCYAVRGSCGKEASTSDLQDVLIYQMEGVGQLLVRLRDLGRSDVEADRFVLLGLFATLTNVNFNDADFLALIGEAAQVRGRLRASYEDAARAQGLRPEPLSGPAAFAPAANLAGVLAQADVASLRAGEAGDDVAGMRMLLLYGLKGVAAYAYHAAMLGVTRDAIFAGVARTLALLAAKPTDIGQMLEESLELGRLNFLALEALDAANTGAFGAPTPANVRITPVLGKAILVSGHDLHDLEAILEATKGTGVNVYTHGELLPAHGYPKLRAYPHLAGNYGGAWQEQQKEFAAFPGPIVMTSNCLIRPQPQYQDRIFTLGPVGWPGVRHLSDGDLPAVIAAAEAAPGFAETAPERRITVGFGHETVLSVAGQIVDAVKAGAIRHFFLVGGCDGAAPGRNYFTDFAESTPKDTVVLTLGCGKYRFNGHEFGTVAGLPRLLDLGQCNDSYSALIVAKALADAFNCTVNDLPLTLVISWFEQKAVAVLLTLLALGVENIRLGPTLPAFLTPGLLDVLVERFKIRPVTSANADLDEALAAKVA